MIKIKSAVLAAAVALGVMGYSAQATVVIPSTLVTWTSGGHNLDITYEVDYDGVSTYTYSYILSSTEAITSFTIAPGVVTQGAVITLTGGATSSYIGADSIGWVWLPGVTGATVAFTSPLGPTFGNASANDNGVSWQAPPLVPTPVPEASTIMAGALMLLPLGVGAFRAIRKERSAKA